MISRNYTAKLIHFQTLKSSLKNKIQNLREFRLIQNTWFHITPDVCRIIVFTVTLQLQLSLPRLYAGIRVMKPT
jgi:hypothetical protein